MSQAIPVIDLDLGGDSLRSFPARLYRAHNPRAAVCYSVGFGGTRESYAYLGKAWAEEGFSTLVIEHPGSNLEVLKSMNHEGWERRRELLWERVQDPQEFTARVQDFLTGSERLGREFPELPIFWGGHSYGSATVLAAAGVASHLCHIQVGEGRPLLCASPQPPGLLFSAEAYAALEHPVLLLTGSQDGDLPEGLEPQARQGAWSHFGGPSYLAVLEGATHMAFAAQGLGVGRFLKPIARLTTLYWKSVLGEATLDREAARAATEPLELEWAQRHGDSV